MGLVDLLKVGPPGTPWREERVVLGDNIPTYILGAGIADATTFLRGDLTWAPAGGGPGSTDLGLSNLNNLTLDVTSSTGTGVTLPEATTLLAGLLIASDKIKLNNTSGINTGDQPSTLSSYINDVPFLTSASLTGYVQDTRQILTGTGLTGGGNLSADRTISISNTAVIAGSYGNATNVASFTVNAQGQLTAAADVPISFPAGFITAVSDTNSVNFTVTGSTLSADVLIQNTATVNLSINASGLKADFTSLLISQFTNDVSYLTSIAGAVTDVTATSPITSSGGSAPNISTLMSTSRIIGRSTVGAGVMEEISLGTGLSFSGLVLNASGAGTNTNQIGAIFPYGGTSAPPGYLLCDGTSYTTASFPDLFAIIGYTYGGAGANFNVPDLRQRFPLGKAVSGTGSTLGGTGGTIDHLHTVDPPNTTSTPPSSTTVNLLPVGVDVRPTNTHTHDVNIPVFNSGTANPPFQVFNYVIKATASGELSDGDRGDITVTGAGSIWTIDNDAVTYAKIQDVTTNRLLGRATAGSGDMEEITLGAGLSFTGTTLNASAGVTSVSGTANRITSTGGATPVIDIGTDVVTLTGAQALSNKTGLISQWTNDAGYITSTGITPSALTKADDTNVTLTLGGTPATALLQASSITVGWTGSLAIARGGTGATTAVTAKNNLLLYTLQMTANQTTISVLAGNITDLVQAVSASSVYSFHGQINIGCNNTGGVKFAITIPAGSTVMMVFSGGASTGTTWLFQTLLATATLTNVAHCRLNDTLGEWGIQVSGTVTTAGTAGNVQFQFASGVAAQTSTIFKEGTFINVEKIT